MSRRFIRVIIAVLIVGVLGCGEEESDIPSGSTLKIVKGLSGDTYMNTKFGVKISNLPVDGWTARALGQDGQGVLISPEGYIPIYWLLLMELVPADQFIGLDTERDLLPMIEADVPVIAVFLDYTKGGSYETHNLTEELDDYVSSRIAEIESKKFVSGKGNTTGIQAVLARILNEEGLAAKEALTWFAKGVVMVRCEYFAQEPKFDQYFPAYINVAENILLMGK